MGSLASGLAMDLASALDAVAMARRVGLACDPWQARLLRSGSSKLLLNCSRQAGKSTVIGLLVLHRALYYPGSLILLLSPGERQSGELFKKVKDSYDRLGRPVKAVGDAATTLTLGNGSRIVALPGSGATVRGYSGAALLVIDEASRVDDQLYYSIRPMLAVSSGKLALLSTPNGKRGFFYREWTEGGPDWERFMVKADQCPRILPRFLEDERRAMAGYFYDQEYNCVFGETTSQLFGHDDIQASISNDVMPLFG